MKTWIQRSLIGLAVVTVTLGGLSACGHHGRWHGHGEMSVQDRAEWRAKALARVARELSLDETQKAKLDALAKAMTTQREALTGGLDRQAMRAEVQSLLAGSTLDRAKAQALLDGKVAAVQGGAPAVIAAAGDFFDSLRPEQQQQVRDFLAKRAQRRG